MSEYCKNCEELLKRATVAEDNFACEVQARLYHQTKWLEYSEECEKYKQALDEIAYLIRSVNGYLLEIVNNDIQSYLVKEGCDALDVIKQIIDIISKAKGEE